jgi:hypothetical protein
MTQRADPDFASSRQGGTESMGSGRQDVKRLFGHFGLDPADYVVSFARPAEAALVTSTTESAYSQVEAGNNAEPDLSDYRNFELTR